MVDSAEQESLPGGGGFVLGHFCFCVFVPPMPLACNGLSLPSQFYNFTFKDSLTWLCSSLPAPLHTHGHALHCPHQYDTLWFSSASVAFLQQDGAQELFGFTFHVPSAVPSHLGSRKAPPQHITFSTGGREHSSTKIQPNFLKMGKGLE